MSDATQPANEPAPESGKAVEPAPTAAEFVELDDQVRPGPEAPLSTLYDLTMPIAIELGRARMTVQELLTLGRGSVIHLDRLAGEPMDVYVGDRRFAEGEVVVIGEQFGIRITRILAQEPRADAA